MMRRLAPFVVLGLLTVSLSAGAVELHAQTFMPPGQLAPGSGTGLFDETNYLPGMRFPIEAAPAYLNSQVWGVGGSQGPAGGQCDVANYSYPWWDSYCEYRSWSMPLCPSGQGHQGVDMRPRTCADNLHWAVAVEAGTITHIGSWSVYLIGVSGIQHRYMHLNAGSLQVWVGQTVTRGQRIGRVSTEFGGTPTTIHLHFDMEKWVAGYGEVYIPPYHTLKMAYLDMLGLLCQCTPGQSQSLGCGNCGSQVRTCQANCQWGSWSACSGQGCVPGGTQSQGCGNCGSQSRTCTGSCTWSAWSACSGQGECAADTVQSEACCDCGTRQRSCSSQCSWSAWSLCDGSDPAGGSAVCDTGDLGPCAAGVQRCVGGCIECERVVEPEPELCDDIDNDCDGEVNNGAPTTMGTPPPTYAARRRDHSSPQVLVAGEMGTVWVEFENAGTETWPAGAFWLASSAGLAMEANRLADPATWPAWDVAAVLDQSVAPGQIARFSFAVRAPSVPTPELAESFVLVAPNGSALGCPEPELRVQLAVLPRAPDQPVVHTPISPPPRATTMGCQSAPTSAPMDWVLMGLAALLWVRRRSGKETNP